ncbi:hypothetical protein MWU52_16840 [Jannaschia sp. S6380]|uniref:LytS/YhcK type 5TM receptor domain-containing protein n=1 Tax=Jannaschia sp. S6380 TaxID=2926408 RepID=UPI001FF10627|nr:LytS/YhcK type 5TM receptor domain-containing protein [Jannaschia sp. S6380]MCK0169223.1 hypothetical protein [Jannaschia sp. S6380]
MTHWTTLLDFLGPLALLGMMAVAFGAVRRLIPGCQLSTSVLGLLFGTVAILQMNAPFSPVDGLIVDMRNVAVALAGAFLGLRGFVICLIIAAAMRLQIGGVGAASGIAAMILAGGAGVLWHAMTWHRPRGIWSMAGLAGLMSVHLLAVVLLPSDLAIWFLSQAAPVIVALNLFAVTLIGLLLERERLRAAEEARLRAALASDPGERLMSREALEWAVTQASISSALRGDAIAIGLRLGHRGLLARLWGAEIDRIPMPGLRRRLEALLPEGGIVGRADAGLIVVAIPGLSNAGLDELCERLRRCVSDAPAHAGELAPPRLAVKVAVRRYEVMPSFATVLADLTGHARSSRKGHAATPVAQSSGQVQTAAGDVLFQTFDRLRELRFGSP